MEEKTISDQHVWCRGCVSCLKFVVYIFCVEIDKWTVMYFCLLVTCCIVCIVYLFCKCWFASFTWLVPGDLFSSRTSGGSVIMVSVFMDFRS